MKVGSTTYQDVEADYSANIDALLAECREGGPMQLLSKPLAQPHTADVVYYDSSAGFKEELRTTISLRSCLISGICADGFVLLISDWPTRSIQFFDLLHHETLWISDPHSGARAVCIDSERKQLVLFFPQSELPGNYAICGSPLNFPESWLGTECRKLYEQIHGRFTPPEKAETRAAALLSLYVPKPSEKDTAKTPTVTDNSDVTAALCLLACHSEATSNGFLERCDLTKPQTLLDAAKAPLATELTCGCLTTIVDLIEKLYGSCREAKTPAELDPSLLRLISCVALLQTHLETMAVVHLKSLACLGPEGDRRLVSVFEQTLFPAAAEYSFPQKPSEGFESAARQLQLRARACLPHLNSLKYQDENVLLREITAGLKLIAESGKVEGSTMVALSGLARSDLQELLIRLTLSNEPTAAAFYDSFFSFEAALAKGQCALLISKDSKAALAVSIADLHKDISKNVEAILQCVFAHLR